MPSDRQIVARSGVGVTAHFIQRQQLLLRRLTADAPMLISVKRGIKRLRFDGRDYCARPGEFVMIDGGCSFDVINEPDADKVYEAVALVFEPELIAETAGIGLPAAASPISPLKSVPAELMEAFERTCKAIADTKGIPQKIALHRARELLAWLESKARPFSLIDATPHSRRVRALVSGKPDQAWRAPEIARNLGMSEASLRRHLAAEKQSLSAIIFEIRMGHALTLLQATDRPITQVAYDVGYESASRFSTRFRDRFGCAPSDIRSAAKV
jgi:AraC-like DNA-binding protein